MNHKLTKEFFKLVRFVVVGTSTFLLQSILYFVFTRWLFTHIPPTVAYVLVLLYSLVFNYSVNRAWTFGDQTAAKGSAIRYVIVAIAASAICALLFWLGYDVLHFYDLYVLVAVNLVIPFFTFGAHRLYTFNDKPPGVLRRFVRPTAR